MQIKNYKEIVLSKSILPSICDCENGGVYFLIKGNEIVYVGKSQDVLIRVRGHIQENRKDFDSYSMIPISTDQERSVTESFYIIAFSPIYNKTVPPKKHLIECIKYTSKCLKTNVN